MKSLLLRIKAQNELFDIEQLEVVYLKDKVKLNNLFNKGIIDESWNLIMKYKWIHLQ